MKSCKLKGQMREVCWIMSVQCFHSIYSFTPKSQMTRPRVLKWQKTHEEETVEEPLEPTFVLQWCYTKLLNNVCMYVYTLLYFQYSLSVSRLHSAHRASQCLSFTSLYSRQNCLAKCCPVHQEQSGVQFTHKNHQPNKAVAMYKCLALKMFHWK